MFNIVVLLFTGEQFLSGDDLALPLGPNPLNPKPQTPKPLNPNPKTPNP